MKKIFLYINLFFWAWPLSLMAATGNYGLDSAAKAAGLPETNTDITQVVANVVNIALSMVGVIFLILFIYGGFKWMLSRGNDKEIEEAKKILSAAVIGLVIIFSAYIITNFVIGSIVSSVGSGGTTGT